MIKPIEQFRNNILEVRKIHYIYQYLTTTMIEGIDIDGLLRTEIVFSISALDQYIHQAIIFEMENILINNKSIPISFSKLLIGADIVSALLNDDSINHIELIKSDIQNKLSWRSYQHPEKINEGIKMVSDKDIWDLAAVLLHAEKNVIKQKLSLIVKRRDCIVHEADYDPVSFGQYYIDNIIAVDSVNFITQLIYAFDSIIYDYSYSDTLFAVLLLD